MFDIYFSVQQSLTKNYEPIFNGYDYAVMFPWVILQLWSWAWAFFVLFGEKKKTPTELVSVFVLLYCHSSSSVCAVAKYDGFEHTCLKSISFSNTYTFKHTVHLPSPLSDTHVHRYAHSDTPIQPLCSYILFAVSGCAGWLLSLWMRAACVQNRCMCAYMYVLYKTHLCACLSGFSSSVCFRKFSCSIWIMERWIGEWNQSNWQLSLWWFDLLSTENQLGGSGAWGAWQIRSPCHRSVISSFNQHSGTANTLFISQTLALALERGFRQV